MDDPIFSFDGDQISMRCDPKEEIIFLVFHGDQDEASATLLLDKVGEFCETLPDGVRLDFVSDASDCGKVPAEARRLFGRLATLPRLRRVATYGINPILRATTMFVMFAAGKRNDFQFHADREASVAWIMSMREKDRQSSKEG